MSYPWSTMNTQELDVQNDIRLNTAAGNPGEVIYKITGTQEWKKINELVARFTDDTDLVQDMNSSPVNINFNTQVFNVADITYGGDTFTFGKDGYYLVNFQCLLSNANAQTMISFFINGTIYYGNLSVAIQGSSSYVPFQIACIIPITAGDVLTVVGEKYDNGPNYLLRNPLYSIAETQLLIKKL